MIILGGLEIFVFLCSLLPLLGEGYRVTKTMTRSAAATPLIFLKNNLSSTEGGMGDGHNTNEKG